MHLKRRVRDAAPYRREQDERTKNNQPKKYYGANAEVKAIDGVDFVVESGEFVSVVGSSGSGKSTLLHLLGGLDRPTDGTVEINGKLIYYKKDDELTIFRRRNIGFVFQSYNLVPVLNVEENIRHSMKNRVTFCDY